MGKKWLILGTVSFGVSLGLGLVINRNLKQAVLTGILSVPASFVGVSVAEHLLKQKFNEKGLTRQEAELSNSISLFSDRVKDLKQQEKDIKGIILTLNEDKQRSQSKLDNLQNQIAQLEDRKSNLKLNIATLKDNLKQFREQEIILAKTVEELFNSQKQIVITLESDRNTLNRLQQQKSDLESTIIGLSADEEQQHKLLAEVNNLQTEIDVIRQEAKEEKQTLAELKIEQEQTTANLIQLREKGNLVQAQIDNCETLKLKLEQDSTQLELEKKRLQTFNSGLNLEIEQLTNQKIELNQFLKNLAREQQELEANCQESRVQLEQLSNSISEQQQLKNQLETEFANLLRQKQDLLLPIQQPQPLAEIQVKPDEVEQEPEEENNTEVPEIKPISDQTDSTEEKSKLSVYIDSHDDYDFSDAKRTKYLWENTVFPYWSHKDRPVGYRFLGNIDIESSESDRLIDIVGQNLQRLNSITDNSLQQSFSALEKDWVKIITFALSEYAYYYSEERFWEGFCDRINIKHNQTVENTLRQVTEQGIDLLGLIKASGGYKYVSTLWLQSGVPKQNLGHFATIVQDLADEYGWWEISHSSAKDIAETLWQYWQDKYSQWGTIRNFLNLDNSNEEVEPISGVLVKNIAIFAKELERQNISPVSLQNEKVREELLINSNLSYSFFLRDWSDLIALLTPREGASDRSIRRRHNQPPYLYLDVADTLNTLLILPEQSLWKKEWRNLRGTYCLIPEAGWEDNIPTQGNLEIPELEIDIKKTAHEWSFQLQNHYRNQIYQWKHKGVDAAFPCLVFDAISGDYIRINIDKPEIKGIGEIILYTPREVKIEVDNNIEIVDI